MNLTRPAQMLLVVAATGLLASAASAGSRCTDDPERCVERGATVSRPLARVATTTPAVLAPAQLAPSVSARKSSMVTRKATLRAAKVTPRASAPSTPAPTPGMGMLLKLSSGGGDVTWQQGRNVDNSGASWIL